MNVSATDRFTIDRAAEIYGLDGWGNGYLAISEDGHLLVTPTRDRTRAIDVHDVVVDLARRGIKTPLLLRVPQLLDGQVQELTGAFAHAIQEYRYAAGYQPIYPIKVNQQRGVVEGLLAAGWKHDLGLEVGSRPELLAAAALQTPVEALIICNGFKDADYLSSASLAVSLGKKVVVVIEKPFEVDQLLELAASGAPMPLVGFRIRLQARGSGLWEKSGGFASKFGLTTRQLLRSIEKLDDAGQLPQVGLLHFHIGSQITEIRKIKNAVREAGRIYAKLHKQGVQIKYLDVGGGLGLDYDGSKTSSDASMNYTVQEYANDIVFGLQEVCEQESVPSPTILSESGRMLVGYHAILIVDVRASISGVDREPLPLTGREPQVVQDLAELERNISVKNYRESYHDSLEYRDQMYSLFNLGLLGLEDRAKSEGLFVDIARKAVSHSKTAKFVADEFVELESKLHDKYICNFSVFQSLPDHWALDQLFPVVPIHRLNEIPSMRATLVDITCDSDGEVDKFVDLKDIKHALEVHEQRPGEPYWLAFVLVGAYQDTMGDMHNLLGRVHEAEVVLDPRGKAVIRNIRRGEHAAQALRYFDWEEEEFIHRVDVGLKERVRRGDLSSEQAAALVEDYRRRLQRYTYLD